MPTRSGKSTAFSATATACFCFRSDLSALSPRLVAVLLLLLNALPSVMAPATNSPAPTDAKPPIYLLDSMAFIFRAYHAMQRQRPMSTRTGIPTAATYVFVNMINKLRKDFQPEYLAAIYDVGAPVHRNELATQLKDVRKFNIKTQSFETVEYVGYKANRTETPPNLTHQHPHIHPALPPFPLPIPYYTTFP